MNGGTGDVWQWHGTSDDAHGNSSNLGLTWKGPINRATGRWGENAFLLRSRQAAAAQRAIPTVIIISSWWLFFMVSHVKNEL